MVELEFEPSEHIKLDLYPATVTRVVGEEETVIDAECRFIVTDSHLYVISTDGIGQPFFVLKEELVEFYTKGSGYDISGVDHDYIAGRNVASCGCGSRLRSMRLLPGVPHISRLGIKNK